jgi:hypothetical protein
MSATMNSTMFADYFAFGSSPCSTSAPSASAPHAAAPAAASAAYARPPVSYDAGWGVDEDGDVCMDHGWGSGGGGGGAGAGSSSGSGRGGWGGHQQHRPSLPLPPPLPPPPPPKRAAVRECPIVEIPGFTHPVRQYFLEDAVEYTGLNLREVAMRAAANGGRGGYGGGGGGGGRGRGGAAVFMQRKRLKRMEQGYEERLQALKEVGGAGVP